MLTTKQKGSQQSGVTSQKRSAWRRGFFCLLIAVSCLLSLGCRQDMQDTPRYEAYEAGSDKFSERGQSSRTLVEGTVPRGFLREDALFYTGRGAAGQAGGGAPGAAAQGAAGAAGAQGPSGTGSAPGQTNVRGNVAVGAAVAATTTAGPDVFPFPIDEAVLRRGQDRFNAFCAMCHGAAGDGDGMIPRRGFQRPPSFHDDRLQEGGSDAGHFFDVITNGWGAMPAYAYMIPPEDRWKIIAYIRALQLSRRLNQNELSEEQRAKVAAGHVEAVPGARADEHQRPGYGGRERPTIRPEEDH